MKPSGVTSIETFSSKAMPLVHSRKVAMPRPRSLPRFFDASRRAAKPFQSASARPWSMIFSKRAAVVGLAHRVLVGHLLGADQVAPAQRRRIHLHLARRRVHQPLDQVDRLGPAGAAVRAGRRGVGEHGGEVQVDRRQVVDAGRDPRADQQLDRDAGRRGVGADVGERLARAAPAPGRRRRARARRGWRRRGRGRPRGTPRCARPASAPGASAPAPRRRRPRLPDTRRSSCRSRRRRRRPVRAPAAAPGRAASPRARRPRPSASGC